MLGSRMDLLQSFAEWAWARHHNPWSWYVRPLFLLPFCWCAWRRSPAGLALTLLSARCDYPEPGRSERAIRAELKAGALPVTLSGGVGTTDRDDTNTWTVTGSKGRIRLRDWSIAEREVDGQWQAPPDALPNAEMRPLILRRQLDKVAAMARGEVHDLASLGEALEVQGVVEQILATGA